MGCPRRRPPCPGSRSGRTRTRPGTSPGRPGVRIRLGGNADCAGGHTALAVQVHLVGRACCPARGPRRGPGRSGGRPRRTCAPVARGPHLARPVGLHPHRGRHRVDVPQERPEERGRASCEVGGHHPTLAQFLCPACTVGTSWETPGMEFVLIAIAILVVALDRRGRPARQQGAPDSPAWTTTPPPARRSPGRARPAPVEEPPPTGASASGLGLPPEAPRRAPRSSCRRPSPSRAWSSRPRRRRPGGWSGCAPGWPARSPPSAAAC